MTEFGFAETRSGSIDFVKTRSCKPDAKQILETCHLSPFESDNCPDLPVLIAKHVNPHLTPSNLLPPELFNHSIQTWERVPDLNAYLHVERTKVPISCDFPMSVFHTKTSPASSSGGQNITQTSSRNVFGVEYESVSAGTVENARNSTSMQRLPEKYDTFTRGTSHSMPFQFGGLGSQQQRFEGQEEVHLDLQREREMLQKLASGREDVDYKTVPPGLLRGISVDNQMAAGSSRVRQLDVMRDLTLTSSLDFDLLKQLEGPSPSEVTKFNNSDSKDYIVEANEEIKEEGEEEEIDQMISKYQPFKVPSKKAVSDQPSARKTWAHMVDTSSDISEEIFTHYIPEPAKEYPFKLDIFQKYAVMHLERGESVFVAAHTSAGKTVVAEYAIALAQKHMTRTIYTSPIKALSNQKFRDFRTTFGESEVGLLTGDVQIRPESPCVIMTTEILRSMLYRGADMIRDVEFVIFDEVHYINDLERGVVWEEVIIMLPAHVNIILLSATVPNTFEFADWVGRTKKKNIYVISTQKRPVPLEHHLFVSSVRPAKLFKIVDANKDFSNDGYKKAYDACHFVKKLDPKQQKQQQQQQQDKKRQVQPQPFSRGGHHQDKNIWINLTHLLTEKSLLPLVVFTFSKKKCEENVDTLSNVDMLSAKEKSEVHVFIERSLSRLKGSDKEVPQIARMKSLLSRGIALHHGGLLPIVKELVEILFSRNLIKILFATETFAMGVNMPARSVAFSGLRKHDGRQFRDLLTGEYIQMSGRAGRRGLDDIGVVIIACSGDHDLPDAATLQTIILGQPTKLQSQFRLTYNMILNLLRVQAIKVEDMMRRSFFEDGLQKDAPKNELLIEEEHKKLMTMDKVECSICEPDIEAMYWALVDWEESNEKMMEECLVKQTAGYGKFMIPGRILLVDQGQRRNMICALLPSTASSQQNVNDATGERTFPCVLLTADTIQEMPIVMPFARMEMPATKDAKCVFARVKWSEVRAITNKKLQIMPDGGDLSGYQSELQSILLSFIKSRNVEEFDLDSKIKDFGFRENSQERSQLMKDMTTFQCSKCPSFTAHIRQTFQLNQVKERIRLLEFKVSNQNLQLLPDYEQRVQVLQILNYVDARSTVQLKGRVACEVNSGNSLVLTELIMENVFSELDAAECASLLSSFVFQERTERSGSSKENILVLKLPQKLQQACQLAVETCARVAETQLNARLDVSVEDYVDETLNFGLCEVVFEWAKGMSFKQIMEITDQVVLEGSIVRAITRLDELCREVRDAARVIGNAPLYTKMDDASASIKRDIVFAASLYV